MLELRRLIDVNRKAERLKGVLFGGLLFEPALDASDPRLVSALEDLEGAQKGLGSNREPTFWSAVLLAKAGNIDAARKRLALAAETNPRWNLLLQRIAAAGVLPADSPMLDCNRGVQEG